MRLHITPAVVCCLLAVGAGQAQDKPPDRFSLPVVLHPQETELWCWAATGQMTMEFLGGGAISQSEQVNRALRRTDCGMRPTPRACIRGGNITLKPYGFTYDESKKPLTEGALAYQLYGLHKPVPFAWYFPGGGGHAALAVGYVRQADGTFLVECLDPYPPAFKDARSWAGGQRLFIPYRRWVSDYDHTFALNYYNVTRLR
jgi:papain like cysteine protease AvrRpt2